MIPIEIKYKFSKDPEISKINPQKDDFNPKSYKISRTSIRKGLISPL